MKAWEESKAISRLSLEEFRSHVQLVTTFLSSLLLRMLAKPLPARNLDHTTLLHNLCS